MKLKLIKIKEEIEGVKSLYWEPLDPFTWKAGQFLEYNLEHENPDNRGTVRWFTISSAPHEKVVMQTTRSFDKPSSFKRKLFSMKPGETIEVSGPKGKFTIEEPSKYLVFVAGGIGITPFRSMLAQSLHDKDYIKGLLIYLNKDKNIVFKNEVDQYIKENSNFKLNYSFDKLNIDTILEALEPGEVPLFYLSGPEPFVEYSEKILLDAGFVSEQIKKDYFPGYVWTP